jgi:hypothetical protein
MGRLTTTTVVILGGAVLLLYAGTQLHLPWINSLAIALFGVFLLVNGIGTVRRKRLGFETTRKNFGPTEVYTGISAQLWGAWFILLSIELFAVAAITVVYSTGNDNIWGELFARLEFWGVFILNIGAMAFIEGVTRLISGSAGYYKGWQNTVVRIGGIFPFAFGVLLVVAGSLMVVAPGFVGGLWRTLVAAIGGRLA